MCANSEGCGETAQSWAFAGRLYDKYHNLMSWLKFYVHLQFYEVTTPGSVTGFKNQATYVYYQRGRRFWCTGLQEGSREC